MSEVKLTKVRKPSASILWQTRAAPPNWWGWNC